LEKVSVETELRDLGSPSFKITFILGPLGAHVFPLLKLPTSLGETISKVFWMNIADALHTAGTALKKRGMKKEPRRERFFLAASLMPARIQLSPPMHENHRKREFEGHPFRENSTYKSPKRIRTRETLVSPIIEFFTSFFNTSSLLLVDFRRHPDSPVCPRKAFYQNRYFNRGKSLP
jgi:hypothetical protein